MLTINETSTIQLQLIDAETDQARIEHAEWQRAQDDDLRMLQDYVHQQQFIVWRPGERGKHKAEEVHLTTADTCTCQRYKLLERCQHTAFVKRLEAANQLPGLETPVTAREVQ